MPYCWFESRALVAVDARPVSYLAHVGPAVEVGVTVHDVQNVLAAVAQIVGRARVMSAAADIAEALDIAIDMVEDDSD
ncbi:MAG TPA: hypothetical protein VHN80_27815 [Kineosporiaceae bacterium]|nr:hypothetical protein [Kineosporiaceae bacterium]